MKTRQSFYRRLIQDQRGAIAITFVLTSSVMLGGTLFAIDMVRHNVVQARLSSALDTAVISAGRKLANYKPIQGGEPGPDWKADAYRYFRANMPENFMGSTIEQDELTIEYSEERVGKNGQYLSAQYVNMTVTGEMPLMSTGYISETAFPIHATNRAVRRVRNDIELVMALDNTGSMSQSSGTSGKDRMAVLKESATQLVDTVMGAAAAGGQTDGTSGAYIGLVPFTDSVNVKDIESAKGWLEYRPEQENYIQNLWMGCIIEPRPAAGKSWTTGNRLPAAVLTPDGRYDESDDKWYGFQPMLSVYSQTYIPNRLDGKYVYLVKNTDKLGSDYNFKGPSAASRDRLIYGRLAPIAPGAQGLDWYEKAKDPTKLQLSQLPQTFWVNLAQESEYCTQSRALFLNQDQTALNASIDDMKAYGGTGVPSGLLWAWRMLHPSWRGATGWGNSDLPRDAGPKLRKVIVLLSDGNNEPVVRRTSQKVGKNDLYQASYFYRECTKTSGGNNNRTCSTWSGVKGGLNDNDYDKANNGPLPEFQQCPIDGLNTVNPTEVTPDNYNQSCTAAATTIGYPYNKTETSRGALTGTALDNYMGVLCANVKNDGNDIQIYALTLGKDVSDGAKTVMRTCASSEDTYFDVSNASDLPEVFAQIAGALTELRLTM